MALTPLLLEFLLLGVCCGDFSISVPETMEVQTGSCVTIPCSFTIGNKYKIYLSPEYGCVAFWKRTKNPHIFLKNMTAVLKGHDCTTTIINVNDTEQYQFRLECGKKLKYTFENKVSIVVQDHPPTLTLTPPTLPVQEGTVVNLSCSTPAPCWLHPPTLTWTPGLGHSRETLEKNSDKTQVKTSLLTFTASHEHNGMEICCTAAHKKQDGTPDVTVRQSTTISLSFPPSILPLSNCSKTPSQVKCHCITVGIPAPTLYWLLDDKPIDPNGTFSISKRSLNSSTTRSVIIFDQHKGTNLSTLLCKSVNSLGSASQRFSVPEIQRQVILPILITTNILFFLLVCFLLFIIYRKQTTNIGKENEASDTAAATNDESLIYSSVQWKVKKPRSPPESSCLEGNHMEVDSVQRFVSCAEEMRSVYAVKPRVLRKEAETEYAQVKFKNKGASRK